MYSGTSPTTAQSDRYAPFCGMMSGEKAAYTDLMVRDIRAFRPVKGTSDAENSRCGSSAEGLEVYQGVPVFVHDPLDTKSRLKF